MTVYLNPALGGRIESTTRQYLDGIEYRLRVFWLAEAVVVPFPIDPGPPPLVFASSGVWAVTLSQSDGTVLPGAGQILRDGVNVIAPFIGDPRYPGAGFGQLLTRDSSGLGRDPGRTDLEPGAAIRLVYRTAAEALAG